MNLVPVDATDYEAILSLADAKAHLNEVDSSKDGLIGDLRDECIDWVESYAKRPMSSRAFRLEMDYFTNSVSFPIEPVTAVSAVAYFDAADVDTTLATSDYVFGAGRLIAKNIWPITNYEPANVRITFTAGEPSKILLIAAKLALTAIYDNRADPDMAPAMRMADKVRTPTI